MVMIPFEIDVKGARIAGIRAGDGSPVIFLHAGVADHRMWIAAMERLATCHTVIAYDRRGFGCTVTPDIPFSHLEDLEALLDQFGLAAASLVGCSMGGGLAIDFALAHPARVTALALIASAVTGAPRPPPPSANIQRLGAAMEAAEAKGDLAALNELEAQLWLDGPDAPPGRIGGAARALFLDMNGRALAHPPLTQEAAPPSAYEKLETIDAPTLVACGDRDLSAIVTRSHELAARIPGAAWLALPGCAHQPTLEASERLDAALAEHLG